MENIELTFGELKTALLCCTVYQNCSGCPLFRGPEEGPTNNCTYHLLSAAMNCINTMEKDLASATKKAADWEEVATIHERDLIALRESAGRAILNVKIEREED